MKYRLLTPAECAEHRVAPLSVALLADDGAVYCDAVFSLLADGTVQLPYQAVPIAVVRDILTALEAASKG